MTPFLWALAVVGTLLIAGGGALFLATIGGAWGGGQR